MSAINPNDLKTSLNHVPITTVNDLSCVDSTVNKIATLNLNQDHQALLKEEEESKQPVQKSLIRENKPPFNIFSMWAQ